MAKGIFKSITKWQNYVHYLILTLIVYFSMGHPFNIYAIAGVYATIFVADTLIHIGFYLAPKPIRWRD